MQLKLTDVSVNLSDKKIIRGLSMDIESPCFLAVTGPNGSGKTTFLKAVAGLLPHEGSISSHPERRSLCLQEHEPTTSLAVKELLLMGRYGRKSAFSDYTQEDKGIVSQWVDKMGVSPLLEEDVMELSGGQRKMVYLTLSLIANEGILLLDEPTQYLDVKNKDLLTSVLKELVRNGTIVLCVSHEGEFTERFKDDSGYKELVFPSIQ